MPNNVASGYPSSAAPLAASALPDKFIPAAASMAKTTSPLMNRPAQSAGFDTAVGVPAGVDIEVADMFGSLGAEGVIGRWLWINVQYLPLRGQDALESQGA